MRSCARSRSGCAICGSWRSGAPRSSNRCASRASSPTEIEAQIRGAETKARLEDIYLPFKPKRRTKAQIAREAGLEPLAEGLLGDPSVDPLAAAAAFVDADKGVADPQAALDGARSILTERFSEDADLIGELRERMWVRGRLAAKVRDGKEEAGAKFADYFDFAEPFKALPSHRDPRHAARREGGRPRPRPGARGALRAARPVLVRGDRRPPFRDRRPRPSRRQVAHGHGPLGLADPHPRAPRHRPAAAAADGRRGRGGQRLRVEPAGPAARRPGGHARDAGPRPRFPYGREGRRGRRDRQGPRHGRHLPARPRQQVGRGHRQARPARQGAHGRADRDRQRHGVPRDGQARR